MSNTQRFRDQHTEILNVATAISKHLSVQELSTDATKVRSLLSDLLGKLTMHLAMEDKALYPRILSGSDESAKVVAKKYIAEMGTLGGAVTDYKNKWGSAAIIQSNPADFIKETQGVFNVLSKRIERENNELYRLVDAL